MHLLLTASDDCVHGWRRGEKSAEYVYPWTPCCAHACKPWRIRGIQRQLLLRHNVVVQSESGYT
jgi:hypothetical protein